MTTTEPTNPPTARAVLGAALAARRPVWVSYHGRQRLVCPHALRWTNNRPMLLAYQTSGHTHTGTLPLDPHQRWRCLRIDHVSPAGPDATWASADNYNPARPFPAIDHLAAAITPEPPS